MKQSWNRTKDYQQLLKKPAASGLRYRIKALKKLQQIFVAVSFFV